MCFHSSYESHALKTREQWESVLSLATRWYFPSIRDLAIKRLERLESSWDRPESATHFSFNPSSTSLDSTDPAKAHIEPGGILAVIHDFRRKSSITLKRDESKDKS
jgi:hypothetical protein